MTVWKLIYHRECRTIPRYEYTFVSYEGDEQSVAMVGSKYSVGDEIKAMTRLDKTAP